MWELKLIVCYFFPQYQTEESLWYSAFTRLPDILCLYEYFPLQRLLLRCVSPVGCRSCTPAHAALSRVFLLGCSRDLAAIWEIMDCETSNPALCTACLFWLGLFQPWCWRGSCQLVPWLWGCLPPLHLQLAPRLWERKGNAGQVGITSLLHVYRA